MAKNSHVVPTNPFRYGMWWARNRYPKAWDRWPEDVTQCVHLALLIAGDNATCDRVKNAVSGQVRKLEKDLTEPQNGNVASRLSTLCTRRARIAKALRMRDEGFTAHEINEQLGGSAAQCAAKHARTTTFRGDRGNEERWGNYAIRRAAARELRQQGRTLKQIAEALGLSVAGAHYACKS